MIFPICFSVPFRQYFILFTLWPKNLSALATHKIPCSLFPVKMLPCYFLPKTLQRPPYVCRIKSEIPSMIWASLPSQPHLWPLPILLFIHSFICQSCRHAFSWLLTNSPETYLLYSTSADGEYQMICSGVVNTTYFLHSINFPFLSS